MANERTVSEQAPESIEQTFIRWLSDGTTWIGIFQNEDLGHPDIGRRIARPYDLANIEAGVVGQTRASDHPSIGLGWRYVLIAKCQTVESAVYTLNHGAGR